MVDPLPQPPKTAREVYDTRDSEYTITFIDAVFLRPKMYTLGGTLEEVGAFVEGFYRALKCHNPRDRAQEEAQHWFDFCAWACQRLDIDLCDWRALFRLLRQRYGTDDVAIGGLEALYMQYRAHTMNESS
jgi:hypothetical protein